jgi:hypothetical protein
MSSLLHCDALVTRSKSAPTPPRKPPAARCAAARCRSRERSSLVMTRDADGVSRTTLLGLRPAVLVAREHALAEFRSLRSRNRRRGAVERPAPFSPTRFAGHPVVVGGPAGSAAAYLRPSARPLGLPASGRASPPSADSGSSPAVARARNRLRERSARRAARRGASRQPLRERRALVRAARLGRAEAVMVLCGAGRVNRATVVFVSSVVTTVSQRAARLGRTEAVAVPCGAVRSNRATVVSPTESTGSVEILRV